MANETTLPLSFDLVIEASKKRHAEVLGKVELMFQNLLNQAPVAAKEKANSLIAGAHRMVLKSLHKRNLTKPISAEFYASQVDLGIWVLASKLPFHHAPCVIVTLGIYVASTDIDVLRKHLRTGQQWGRLPLPVYVSHG